MALVGVILSVFGAAVVMAEYVIRWRTTTVTIDGGRPDTDFAAEELRAKRRALAWTAGPALVLVGASLSALAL
ncbi:hypothetical protein SAMN05660748_4500 [Blastococcus aggregatus]|uniref:Uncharacterized protein n=1 Tax=Blastococcus aggregatus TaxID=38502 RepID=A0A285VHU6_9ACTN|nr:hypothetical protein [Blastococcus aggregatus]SOC53573.1 hypothetical protein SAMN05660748_4500 [Blastococcus aggregatus]